jgi:hypothetical protein
MQILRVTHDPLPFSPSPQDTRPGAQRQRARIWTESEDQRLIAGLHRYGLDNWPAIAEFVGNGRTRSQCAQRWNRGLNPDLCKGPWTGADEDKLESLVARYGEKSWKKVSSHFGNRSDVQCRYHYQQQQRNSLRRYTRTGQNPYPEPDPARMAAEARLVFEEFPEFGFQRDEDTQSNAWNILEFDQF